MIHPEAVSEPLLGPLHKSFLLGCFFSGAVALLVMPLHLALAGPPPAAAVLMFTWMLGQWPLALYLSRSGNLERSLMLSAALFAFVTAAICALSGGAGSVAVIWFAVPCIEAAFAARQKTALLIAGLCCVLYGALVFLPSVPGAAMMLPEQIQPVVILGALVYAGVLACRLISDRVRMRDLQTASLRDFRTLNSSLSGLVCEIPVSGGIRVLGGPVRRLFGAAYASAGRDWICARIHVADRPLYLTRLSEARHSGRVSRLELRMRVCSNGMDDADGVHFASVEVRLTPTGSPAGGPVPPEGQAVLVAMDLTETKVRETSGDTAEIEILAPKNEPQPDEGVRRRENLAKSA